MTERYVTGWTDPRMPTLKEPKYAYQVRYSFGLDGKTKKGYMVVKYDITRTYLEAEVLAHGLTHEVADGFIKLLEEN
jgi:hypothetical protein